MRRFFQRLYDILEEIVRKEYNIELKPPLWELPPRQEFGDLSSMAALKIASQIKGDALEIAAILKAELEKSAFSDIEKIEVVKPGFVNIFLSKEQLIESLNDILLNKEDFFRHKLKGKVLLEFLSANPTGPLSIAHGRQAVVGDVIANILSFFGDEVTKEYYVNDAGKQLDLFVQSVKERVKEINAEAFAIPEGGYHGEYIKEIAKACLKENASDIRKFAIEYALCWIKKDLNSLGIKFDSWVSQQEIIDNKKIEETVELLRAKGLIYKKDGALWFPSTKFGDDKDRVIKKKDAELTYFASDIAYHNDKIKRGYSRLINLWGPDHHGYIERVKSSLEALGYSKDILNVIIIQLVSLKTKEKMSKRKGTAVLLCDLIEEMGKDTIRFYYLVRKNSSHLEFDLDLAKTASFDNPLYYIQYCSARIESIFSKAKPKGFDAKHSRFLETESELKLLRLLLQFLYALEKAYYSLEPVFIIEYLKNLAAGFHKFYETTRVLQEQENITFARLNLLQATKIVIHCALNLLGITPVKKM